MTDESGGRTLSIDFTRIQETSGGDIEFEQELFAAYLEDCAERLGRLEAARAAGDDTTFRREAHTIKGASANVGTTRLHELAHDLEAAGLSDGIVIEKQMALIDAEFQHVKTAIEAYLASL